MIDAMKELVISVVAIIGVIVGIVFYDALIGQILPEPTSSHSATDEK